MNVIRTENLPFVGSSWNFVGADHGDVAISFYVVNAPPGRGAPLHCHEYDEVVVVQAGHPRFVVGDLSRDAAPGDILVIKAGTPHGFVNAGSEDLRQIDITPVRLFSKRICRRRRNRVWLDYRSERIAGISHSLFRNE